MMGLHFQKRPGRDRTDWERVTRKEADLLGSYYRVRVKGEKEQSGRAVKKSRGNQERLLGWNPRTRQLDVGNGAREWRMTGLLA